MNTKGKKHDATETRAVKRSLLSMAMGTVIAMMGGTAIAADHVAIVTDLSTPTTEPRAEKLIYSVSGSKGALGVRLEGAGWGFQNTKIYLVPNDESTIFYVNAVEFEKGDDNIAKFLESFRGILVVDSDRLIHAAGDNLGSGVSAGAVYLDLAKNIPGKIGKAAFDGSGVVALLTYGSLQAIDIGEDGSINGAPPDMLEDMVDFRRMAVSNAQPRAKNANEVEFGIDVIRNGWRAVGRVTANAYRSNPGTTNESWFVETTLFTGSQATACQVNGRKCGIYPASHAEIFETSLNSSSQVDVTA